MLFSFGFPFNKVPFSLPSSVTSCFVSFLNYCFLEGGGEGGWGGGGGDREEGGGGEELLSV